MLDFIGHLHPLIVHLPIGILLLGVFMLVYQHFSKVNLQKSISLAFLMGSISAVLACIAGWLLSNSGEYDALLIQKHQWTGITTAAIGWLAYLFKQYRKILVILLSFPIFITGHYGGTLTHGENYLFNAKQVSDKEMLDTLKKASEKITKTIANGSDSLTIVKYNTYKEVVAPILKLRCYNCHSVVKQKNGLRLDGELFIKKGGKNGAVLVEGNSLKSTLYTSLVMPIDDEKHMPPKGKHQLSQNEILIIEDWIKSGASFEDKIDTITKKELANKALVTKNSTDKIIAANANSATIAPDQINKKNNITSTAQITTINEANPSPISPAIIEDFKKENIILTYIAEGSHFVMANFVNVVPFNKNSLQNLLKIKQQLVILKLTNLPIDDHDIKMLSELKNIKKLNVENTFITDNGISYLKQLSELEQLNLYATNITDEGLNQLAALKKLSALYLWKTKVTSEGVEKFKKTHPTVNIEIGNFKFQKK